MPAATLEELGDDLDANLQWRRLELAALRSEIERLNAYTQDRPLGRSLLRAGVALLYAHWEGFTKEACQAYLDFVARRRLKVGELSDAFVLLTVRRLARRMSDGDDVGTKLLLKHVRKGTEMRPSIPRHNIVEPVGNLRHGVLAAIFDQLGLPMGALDTKGQLVDRALCDARNDIAHGRASFPSKMDFLTLHHEVIAMMETVRDIVLASAKEAGYRAPAG